MKKPPTHGWRLTRIEPRHNYGFDKLVLEILPLTLINHRTFPNDRRPIPVYDRDLDQHCEFRWQASPENRAPGTDVPTWYGCHLDLSYTRIAAIGDFHKRLTKWFPESLDRGCGRGLDPAGAVDRLLDLGIPRVAYYAGAFGHIEARHWAEACQWETHCDAGIRSEGCTVHAYARPDDDPAAAVSAALRASTYCTDAEYATWVSDGRRTRRIHAIDPQNQHAPQPLTHYFGHPVVAADDLAQAA